MEFVRKTGFDGGESFKIKFNAKKMKCQFTRKLSVVEEWIKQTTKLIRKESHAEVGFTMELQGTKLYLGMSYETCILYETEGLFIDSVLGNFLVDKKVCLVGFEGTLLQESLALFNVAVTVNDMREVADQYLKIVKPKKINPFLDLIMGGGLGEGAEGGAYSESCSVYMLNTHKAKAVFGDLFVLRRGGFLGMKAAVIGKLES